MRSGKDGANLLGEPAVKRAEDGGWNSTDDATEMAGTGSRIGCG